MSVAKPMDGLAWTMLVLLAVLWGASFVFIAMALEAMPVLTVVSLRVCLAAITLWAVVAVTGIAVPRVPAVWRALAILGVLNNVVPFCLIVWGQTSISAGLAAILTATTPIFTGFLAGIFLADERLSASRLVGLGLGLAGVVVIVGPGALLTLGTDLWAQIAILGAAFSYAVSSVFARRFRTLGVRPLMIATGQTSMSSLVMLPLALVIDGPSALAVADAGAWAAVAGLSVAGTALAYILYFAILERAGATNVVLVTVLVPVVALAVGAVVLSEPVEAGQLAGMALIIVGLAVIDGRLWRRTAGVTLASKAPPAA